MTSRQSGEISSHVFDHSTSKIAVTLYRCLPVKPVWPVAPVTPRSPVRPEAPIEPCGPWAPDDPVWPVPPVFPVSPEAPVDPGRPVDPKTPDDPLKYDIQNDHLWDWLKRSLGIANANWNLLQQNANLGICTDKVSLCLFITWIDINVTDNN